MEPFPTISRLRQFSLRTGVVLFLALCVAFGFAARWYHDVKSRGEAQRRLFQRDQNNTKQDGIDVYVRYAPKSLAIGPRISDDVLAILRERMPECKIQKLSDSLRAE